MKKLVLLPLILSLFCTPASGQHPTWINVKDYGAKATFGTDDTPSITAAIKAALALPQHHGETVVYFPAPAVPGYYDIKTPLTLPGANRRVTLVFDSPLYIEATITIRGGYTLRGTESQNGAFNPAGGTPFVVGYNVNPAVHIQATGLTLENISFGYVHDQSDGIVIDGASSSIRLKNCGVAMDKSNTVGIPLKITGGFSYWIEGGGYISAGAPAIQYNDDTKDCVSTGMLYIRDIFLGGNGIQLNNRCGAINSISIDGVLYENANHPLMTVIVSAGSPIFGVEIRNSHLADSWGTPLPPLIDVQCPKGMGSKGFGMGNVTIVNSTTDGPTLTTGEPIYGLEVWSSRDYVVGAIAQKDHFIYHGPHGIKDTMPRLP